MIILQLKISGVMLQPLLVAKDADGIKKRHAPRLLATVVGIRIDGLGCSWSHVFGGRGVYLVVRVMCKFCIYDLCASQLVLGVVMCIRRQKSYYYDTTIEKGPKNGRWISLVRYRFLCARGIDSSVE